MTEYSRHKIKVIFTIIAATILVMIYLLIFVFSASDGEQSGELSGKVTSCIITFMETLSGVSLSWKDDAAQVEAVEHQVRKTAHMIEFAMIGFWSYGIILCWHKNRRKGIPAGIAILVVSAALDEWHQYFVPGRYASFTDIGIDTLGGMLGMLFIFIIWKISKRKLAAV